jgi:hypothetical protein
MIAILGEARKLRISITSIKKNLGKFGIDFGNFSIYLVGL